MTQCSRRVEARLARVMPNVGGPTSTKRKMLHGVMQSIMTYDFLIEESSFKSELCLQDSHDCRGAVGHRTEHSRHNVV